MRNFKKSSIKVEKIDINFSGQGFHKEPSFYTYLFDVAWQK